MTTFAVRWDSLSAFYLKYEKYITGLFAFFVLLPILIWRAAWHSDLLSLLPLVVVLFSWFIALMGMSNRYGFNLTTIRWVSRLSAVSMLSLFMVFGTAGTVALSPQGQTSTLTTPILLTAPFLGNITLVPYNNDQEVGVKVSASDGVPLACIVEARGIMLDTRDIPALEKILFAGDTVRMLNANLAEVIRAESAKVLGQLTAAQIADPLRKFTIPYAIGTPLGAALAANGLHWEGGNVSYSCRLDLNS